MFQDEIIEADRAGKETAMQALARLSPAQQVGVLGKTKREVFAAGKLAQSMIRALWAAVRKRIGGRVQVADPVRDNAAMSDFPQPARTAWGEFPDVLIHADEGATKRHPDYAAAKAGDVRAAKQLVANILNDAAVERLRQMIGGRQVTLVPVHAVEAAGINKIPAVMAEVLSERLGRPSPKKSSSPIV